ncbi:MAG TPA: sugar ABC transporter permease YjfF, partial [Actinotalea sp.]|nr:sugar ABC transporter permease YjfF [Actinotalea sp.]
MSTTVAPVVRNERPVSRYEAFMSRRGGMMPTFAAVLILLLLFIGAEVFLRGNFITPGNISALLLDNAYLLVLAVGMTFVILTAGIDLSVGSVMAFTGILGAQLL